MRFAEQQANEAAKARYAEEREQKLWEAAKKRFAEGKESHEAKMRLLEAAEQKATGMPTEEASSTRVRELCKAGQWNALAASGLLHPAVVDALIERRWLQVD